MDTDSANSFYRKDGKSLLKKEWFEISMPTKSDVQVMLSMESYEKFKNQLSPEYPKENSPLQGFALPITQNITVIPMLGLSGDQYAIGQYGNGQLKIVETNITQKHPTHENH